MLEGSRRSTKNGLEMGVTIGGDADKSGQEHSFVSDNVREVIRQSAYLYHKLMCSFSIPFSLSYSYVPYSNFIYPVPKLCTASSGKITRFPNGSLYIISYYSQASQRFIGIINHGSN